MAGLAAACMVAVGALGPNLGWGLTRALLSLVGRAVRVLRGALAGLRAGWFHPAIHWLNVAIEVSIPSVVLAFDLRFQGPAYALTAPTLVIWGTLVVLAALRTQPLLALVAGALAGGEYLLLYFFFVRPLLPGSRCSRSPRPSSSCARCSCSARGWRRPSWRGTS